MPAHIKAAVEKESKQVNNVEAQADTDAKN
jgi:hypothetical protein